MLKYIEMPIRTLSKLTPNGVVGLALLVVLVALVKLG